MARIVSKVKTTPITYCFVVLIITWPVSCGFHLSSLPLSEGSSSHWATSILATFKMPVIIHIRSRSCRTMYTNGWSGIQHVCILVQTHWLRGLMAWGSSSLPRNIHPTDLVKSHCTTDMTYIKHAFLESPLTYFQSLNSFDPTDMMIKGIQDGWGSFPLEELPAKPLLTWHWSGTCEAILLLPIQDKTFLSINPHQLSQLLYTMNSSFTQVHVLAAQCIHEWTVWNSMWVYYCTKPLRMADSWSSISTSKSEEGTIILQTLRNPTVHVTWST